MDDLCHRCGGELPRLVYPGGHERRAPQGLEPDALLFCPHCSAPQIRLPEHMRPLAAAQATASTTGSAPPPHPRSVDWPVALAGAAAVAVIGAVLNVVGAVSMLVSAIAFVWICSCAFFTLSQYVRRRPEAWMDARTGFRIGVAAAVLMLGALAPATAITGAVQRFGTHTMNAEDVQVALQLRALADRSEQMMKEQGATSDAQKWLAGWIESPEVLAGAELAGMGLSAVVLLLFAGGTGAMAGAAGARRRRLVLNR